MPVHRWSSALSLARQGLALELDFGSHSVEALLWVAETVEEAVYARGSLVRVDGDLRFALRNPPLRVGAFRGLRIFVNGTPVPPGHVRFRSGADRPWRVATTLTANAPLELAPGQRSEYAVEATPVPARGRASVRLELDSVAIPPTVWVEFEDTVRRTEGP